jgi:hypothetical protein
MNGATPRLDCKSTRTLVIDEALSQATPAERAAVEAHLSTCALCRAEAAALAKTLAMLRAPTLAAPSAGFGARLESALDAVDAAAQRRLARGPRRERAAARLLDHGRFRLVLLGHQLRHSRRWQLRVAAALLPLCVGVALMVAERKERVPLEVAFEVPPTPAPVSDPVDQPLVPADLVQWTPRFDDPVDAPAPALPPPEELLPAEPEQAQPVLDRLNESNAAELAKLRAADRRPPALATVPPPRQALDRSLDWLARNQRPDGSFTTGDGTPGFEVGVTALALMALVADGHLGGAKSQVTTGPAAAEEAAQASAAARAAGWLAARQDADGRFRGGGDAALDAVNHSLATLALVERHLQLRARFPGDPAAAAAAHDRLEQALAQVEIALDRELNGTPSRHSGAVAVWSALALATAREGGVEFHLKPASAVSSERMLAQLSVDRSDLLAAASQAVQAMAARQPTGPIRDPGWAAAVGNVVAAVGKAEPSLRFLVASALVAAPTTQAGDWERFATALRRELLAQQGATGFFAADQRWDGIGGGTAYETALGALALQVEVRRRSFIAARDALGVARGR